MLCWCMCDKCKGTKIAETSLKKKNETGGITLPNIKANIAWIATVFKTVWCLQDRHIDQYNRIEDP